MEESLVYTVRLSLEGNYIYAVLTLNDVKAKYILIPHNTPWFKKQDSVYISNTYNRYRSTTSGTVNLRRVFHLQIGK